MTTFVSCCSVSLAALAVTRQTVCGEASVISGGFSVWRLREQGVETLEETLNFSEGVATVARQDDQVPSASAEAPFRGATSYRLFRTGLRPSP